MKSLHRGLFGGVNDPSNAQWHLLDEFRQADLYRFTTYPRLLYETAESILADYYAELAEKADKPQPITEVGWPSRTEVPGWEYDKVEQSELVDLLFTMV